MSDIATRLAEVVTPLVGEPLPVRLVCWDGSVAGPPTAPTVTLTSPRALRRLLWKPGELGAAQAFVTGEIEIDRPVEELLRHLWSTAEQRQLAGLRLSASQIRQALSVAKDAGMLGRPLPAPASQIAVRGRLHSRRRDREVVHAHYDLSNDFYGLILDEHRAYSCGYVTGAPLEGAETATYRLEDAQRDKLDLVCRKLGLHERTGLRLLDIGCGWGALALYAAQTYGAVVTGVTIAGEQQQFIQQRARERGLEHLVTIRLQDYRDVADGPYDAIASLEMGEHAGERGYPAFVRTLAANAGPHTPILVQQMSRAAGNHPGGGPFIEAFIAPDMTMRPIGQTLNLLEAGGLEVRDVHALREHYVWTVRGWRARFDRHREQLSDLLGAEMVRVWDLYLAGGLLAFEQGRMGVDQILLVPHRPGLSRLPAVRVR